MLFDRRLPRIFAALAAILALSLTVAACGGDDETSSESSNPQLSESDIPTIKKNLEKAGFEVTPLPAKVTNNLKFVPPDTTLKGLSVPGVEQLAISFIIPFKTAKAATISGQSAVNFGQKSAIYGKVLFVGPVSQESIDEFAATAAGNGNAKPVPEPSQPQGGGGQSGGGGSGGGGEQQELPKRSTKQ